MGALPVLQICQMGIRFAAAGDLAAIVKIYNDAIPGRLATADTVPVSVASREGWFAEFDPERRPLWVYETESGLAGWVSLRSFYGRPAYGATVEIAVYCAALQQRRGFGRTLVDYALTHAPRCGIRTVLAFVFAHNGPSVRLFETAGFASWGLLPRVAELDGVERDLAILGKRVA